MLEEFELHWERGWGFYKAEKQEEALAEWYQASSLDRGNGYVRNNIGMALSKSNQLEEAIEEWREAVRLEPDYASPHVNLAYALSASGYSLEALTAVRAAIRLRPDSPGLYNSLGYHLLVQGNQSNDKTKWTEAGEAFQQSIVLNSSHSYARRHLAKTQWYLRKKQEAINTLKDAIVADPTDAEAHIQLHEYQAQLGDLRGMIHTIHLMQELPESEVMDKHYAGINQWWIQVEFILFAVASLTAFLGLIWLHRRRR